jgi:hypothetical protein
LAPLAVDAATQRKQKAVHDLAVMLMTIEQEISRSLGPLAGSGLPQMFNASSAVLLGDASLRPSSHAPAAPSAIPRPQRFVRPIIRPSVHPPVRFGCLLSPLQQEQFL